MTSIIDGFKQEATISFEFLEKENSDINPTISTKVQVLNHNQSRKISSSNINNENKISFSYYTSTNEEAIVEEHSFIVHVYQKRFHPDVVGLINGFCLEKQKITPAIYLGPFYSTIDLGIIKDYFDSANAKKQTNETKLKVIESVSKIPYIVEKINSGLFDVLGEEFIDSDELAEMGWPEEVQKLTPTGLIYILMKYAIPYRVNDDNTVTWHCDLNRIAKTKEGGLLDIKVVGTLDPEKMKEPKLKSIEIISKDGDSRTTSFDNESDDEQVLMERGVDIGFANVTFYTLGTELKKLLDKISVGLCSYSFNKCIVERFQNHPLFEIILRTNGGNSFVYFTGPQFILKGVSENVAPNQEITAHEKIRVCAEGIKNEMTWRNFQPVQPLANKINHPIAYLEKQLYDEYIDSFTKQIDEKWGELSKNENWNAIFRFSENLHHHVDAFPTFIEGQYEPRAGDKENLVKTLAYYFMLVIANL